MLAIWLLYAKNIIKWRTEVPRHQTRKLISWHTSQHTMAPTAVLGGRIGVLDVHLTWLKVVTVVSQPVDKNYKPHHLLLFPCECNKYSWHLTDFTYMWLILRFWTTGTTGLLPCFPVPPSLAVEDDMSMSSLSLSSCDSLGNSTSQ